jgi:hypothetical protein
MTYYHQNLPVETWQRPPGLVDVTVDSLSGLLPGQYSTPIREMFLEGIQPTRQDDVHQALAVNRETGKLAVAGCTPPELIEQRVYEIFPSVANDWITENEIPQPPHEYDDNCAGGIAAGPAAITYPRQFDYIHGGIIITGNARLDGFQLYRLEYGSGLNPGTWQQLGGDHTNPVDNGPMEFWDTSNLEEGLYTLQLTVLRGDSSFERYASQVTIDNTPPEAEVINPNDGKVYVLEDDEYVNFQVDSNDNFAMDRVEYFVDNQKIGETTIAPYTIRWPLSMEDITIVGREYVITQTQPLLNPDGSPVVDANGQVVSGPIITLTRVTSITQESDAAGVIGYTQAFSGGKQIISTLGGYTETHLLRATAYDAAGNKVETAPVRISIIHEPEEEEEDNSQSSLPSEGALSEQAALLPEGVTGRRSLLQMRF